MGLPSDYVETRRKWGCCPEGRGADIKLRKLQEGDGGHAAAQRHKEARRHTHERAREHTQPLVAHTSAAHAAAPRGDCREEPQLGPGSPSRRAPAKACATGGGSSPPSPAQPRLGAARCEPGKGVCPPAAQGAEGRGGARPWGRGPGAYKIALRPDINKSCLPGHPLPRLIARSLILASLFTSRWAPRRQPCWHLSVLAH